jgi:AbrB family looped-hinge helix DNA binding protein
MAFVLLRKPDHGTCQLFDSKPSMSTLLVSSRGQIVLPAELRRRLGMGAGARIEVLEQSDGLKLRVARSVATADIGSMAGGWSRRRWEARHGDGMNSTPRRF